MFCVSLTLLCRRIAWISLSSTPSAWRFVARPRRKARQPCHWGRDLSRSNRCPSGLCSSSRFWQTAQRVSEGLITWFTRFSKLRGSPFPAWKIGPAASLWSRSLCASSASASTCEFARKNTGHHQYGQRKRCENPRLGGRASCLEEFSLRCA